MSEHSFSRDERVRFSQRFLDDPALADSQVARGHLDEVFEVVSVEPVSTKCTCGAGESGFHRKECGVNALESVGHHQYVTIMIGGQPRCHSGALLQPA